MSADALVSDAIRAPVDVMLPMCILQILSFYWCRFLSYSCTVCMSRNVRESCLPCVTSVTWTNLSLYLIITWRINRQHDDRTVLVNARGSIYVGLMTKLSFKEYISRNMLRGPSFVVFYRNVINTDHLTNIVQDYSIGSGANILLHQSDITSGLIVKNMGQ